MKDHKKAELVTKLVDIAVEYHKKPLASIRNMISSLLISELGQAELQYHQEVDDALYACLGISLATLQCAYKERNGLDVKSLRNALNSLDQQIAVQQGMIEDILGKILKIGNIYVFKIYGDFGSSMELSGKLIEVGTSGKVVLETPESWFKYHTVHYEDMKVFYDRN